MSNYINYYVLQCIHKNNTLLLKVVWLNVIIFTNCVSCPAVSVVIKTDGKHFDNKNEVLYHIESHSFYKNHCLMVFNKDKQCSKHYAFQEKTLALGTHSTFFFTKNGHKFTTITCEYTRTYSYYDNTMIVL